MPERDKSVERITRTILGTNLPGKWVDKKLREGVMALVDTAWVNEVRKIDFNRVLLTAEARHRALRDVEKEQGLDHHGFDTWKASRLDMIRPLFGMEFGDDEDNICPECLVESLLLLQTMDPKWEDGEEERKVKRDREDALWRQDWINDSDGVFVTVQRAIPHVLEAAEHAEANRKPVVDPDA